MCDPSRFEGWPNEEPPDERDLPAYTGVPDFREDPDPLTQGLETSKIQQ